MPEASESDRTFEPDKSESKSAKCKQRGGDNRSQLKAPKVKGTANTARNTKEKPAKTRTHLMIHMGFRLVVVFLYYCLLFLSLAGRSLVMQQKSSLEMQSAIYFSASWQNLHSVFRRTIIAGFFLRLFFLQFSYFWL